MKTPQDGRNRIPEAFAVSFCPKSGIYGREAQQIKDLHAGNSWGSACAVFTLPTAIIMVDSQRENCTRNRTMKNRKLKVRLGYYDLPATTERARSSTYVTNPKVPFILLKGYWLERANFLINTPLDVYVQENRLIITVAGASDIRDRPA